MNYFNAITTKSVGFQLLNRSEISRTDDFPESGRHKSWRFILQYRWVLLRVANIEKLPNQTNLASRIIGWDPLLNFNPA